MKSIWMTAVASQRDDFLVVSAHVGHLVFAQSDGIKALIPASDTTLKKRVNVSLVECVALSTHNGACQCIGLNQSKEEDRFRRRLRQTQTASSIRSGLCVPQLNM